MLACHESQPSIVGSLLPRSITCLLVALVLCRTGVAEQPVPDFRFEILPILAQNCFSCHGPDESHREADLRLDVPDAVIQSGVIKPGEPEVSELFQRLTNADEAVRMPPPTSGYTLNPDEIDALRRWILSGAKYARHWSYEPPKRPTLPIVSAVEWCHNSIDFFVLERLERAGLEPEPESDRNRLIRRLSLDLTGLPPTPDEVADFTSDRRADAYERLVDRLLASPAFGEHWSVKWLDLARYADTCGYEKDSRRTIWPFRNWVIKALNADMPFDQFTIEQLSGDLLPDPTREQLIATAFHRNTMQNDEGGTDDEEFRDAAVVDRVNTTMQVWMGTTMGCCRCHSHKYDPLSLREYYELFAFFNQTADADRYDQEPTLQTPSVQQQQLKSKLEQRLSKCKEQYELELEASQPDRRTWEQSLTRRFNWTPLRSVDAESRSKAECTINEDGSFSISSNSAEHYSLQVRSDLPRIAAIRLESILPESESVIARLRVIPALPKAKRIKFVRIELPKRHDYLALAEVQVYCGDQNVAVHAKARQSSTAYEGTAELAIDGRTDGHFATGRSVTHTAFELNPWWEIELPEATHVDRVVLWNRDEFSERLAKSRVLLLDADRQTIWSQDVLFAPDLSATLETSGRTPSALAYADADSEAVGHSAQHPIENGPSANGWSPDTKSPGPHWLTVAFEQPLDIEGVQELRVLIDEAPTTNTAPQNQPRRFRLVATDDADVIRATVPPDIRAAAATPVARRTNAQADALAKHYARFSPRLLRLAEERADVERQLSEGVKTDKTPIMRELPIAERRKTHIHIRGNFMDEGELVEPDTPSIFPPFPADSPRNRLGLAKWLIDRRNPLTARVTANRQWEQLFGSGIVATSEDFGSQGSLPSHPELLDCLAVELTDHNWSLKHLTKTIVMSATYRQSSKILPRKLELDPENRLFSRGPRIRLSAEQLRDQALFTSGLLSRKMFGPSVMPFQPDGVWQVVYSDDQWEQSKGEDRYRRGLYTYWRRTSPYPSAMAFDATSRETCTVRRICTNTPVAAFALLNDPTYVEAAQALARRISSEAAGDSVRGATFAFRTVLLRPPTLAEVDRVASLFSSLREHYEADMGAASQMASRESGPAESSASLADLAAWTVVSNVLLNLDETVNN